MYIDVTGIILIPGNYGSDCPGNGMVPAWNAAVMNAISFYAAGTKQGINKSAGGGIPPAV